MDKEQLVQKAKEAMKHAYAPYSRFPVGAAVLTDNGDVYTGVNVENASFGLTNCAERTALYKAYSEGERAIKAIAVIAETEEPISPCGACRQVMSELCRPETTVLLANKHGQFIETTVKTLLPGAFSMEEWHGDEKRV